MGNTISDGTKMRIAEDTQMIFMARTMERLFGTDSLDVLVEHLHEKSKKRWQQTAEDCGRQDPGYLKCMFTKDAHEYEIIQDDPERLEVKVTKCVHADVFQSYNATDLGEKLICSGDYAAVAGYNPHMKLTRPTTCMSGNCCHFIFELRNT